MEHGESAPGDADRAAVGFGANAALSFQMSPLTGISSSSGEFTRYLSEPRSESTTEARAAIPTAAPITRSLSETSTGYSRGYSGASTTQASLLSPQDATSITSNSHRGGSNRSPNVSRSPISPQSGDSHSRTHLNMLPELAMPSSAACSRSPSRTGSVAVGGTGSIAQGSIPSQSPTSDPSLSPVSSRKSPSRNSGTTGTSSTSPKVPSPSAFGGVIVGGGRGSSVTSGFKIEIQRASPSPSSPAGVSCRAVNLPRSPTQKQSHRHSASSTLSSSGVSPSNSLLVQARLNGQHHHPHPHQTLNNTNNPVHISSYQPTITGSALTLTDKSSSPAAHSVVVLEPIVDSQSPKGFGCVPEPTTPSNSASQSTSVSSRSHLQRSFASLPPHQNLISPASAASASFPTPTPQGPSSHIPPQFCPQSPVHISSSISTSSSSRSDLLRTNVATPLTPISPQHPQPYQQFQLHQHHDPVVVTSPSQQLQQLQPNPEPLHQHQQLTIPEVPHPDPSSKVPVDALESDGPHPAAYPDPTGLANLPPPTVPQALALSHPSSVHPTVPLSNTPSLLPTRIRARKPLGPHQSPSTPAMGLLSSPATSPAFVTPSPLASASGLSVNSLPASALSSPRRGLVQQSASPTQPHWPIMLQDSLRPSVMNNQSSTVISPYLQPNYVKRVSISSQASLTSTSASACDLLLSRPGESTPVGGPLPVVPARIPRSHVSLMDRRDSVQSPCTTYQLNLPRETFQSYTDHTNTTSPIPNPNPGPTSVHQSRIQLRDVPSDLPLLPVADVVESLSMQLTRHYSANPSVQSAFDQLTTLRRLATMDAIKITQLPHPHPHPHAIRPEASSTPINISTSPFSIPSNGRPNQHFMLPPLPPASMLSEPRSVASDSTQVASHATHASFDTKANSDSTSNSLKLNLLHSQGEASPQESEDRKNGMRPVAACCLPPGSYNDHLHGLDGSPNGQQPNSIGPDLPLESKPPLDTSLLAEPVVNQPDSWLEEIAQSRSPSEFEAIRTIGKGRNTEVRLVRHRKSGSVCVMKIVDKRALRHGGKTRHIDSELAALKLLNTPWVVKLYTTFEDADAFYFIMEFVQGGDLMSVLMKRGTLTIEESKFYAAQIAVAIHEVHKIGFAHRDVKPDNVLIDRHGHIKLADLGLSKCLDPTAAQRVLTLQNPTSSGKTEDGSSNCAASSTRKTHIPRHLAYSAVGTLDYIAPEIISRCGHDQRCDWWSLGVILYECLVGYAPFFADTPQRTCANVLNFRHTLKFPTDTKMPLDAIHLIKRLVSEPERRAGFHEINSHPFFRGIDWNHLRSMPPPFVPELSGDTDTRYFDDIELLTSPRPTPHPLPSASPTTCQNNPSPSLPISSSLSSSTNDLPCHIQPPHSSTTGAPPHNTTTTTALSPQSRSHAVPITVQTTQNIDPEAPGRGDAPRNTTKDSFLCELVLQTGSTAESSDPSA